MPGFSRAPGITSYAPVNAPGYATSETIIFGSDVIKQISASLVDTSDIDTFTVADLRVTIYSGANGFNHAGIGVNSNQTYGLYPTKKPVCLVTDCTVPGKVQQDTEQPISTVVIKTTPAQDVRAQNAINKAIDNPPSYNLYHENCASFVESILKAAGVKNVPKTISPNALGNALGCRR